MTLKQWHQLLWNLPPPPTSCIARARTFVFVRVFVLLFSPQVATLVQGIYTDFDDEEDAEAVA